MVTVSRFPFDPQRGSLITELWLSQVVLQALNDLEGNNNFLAKLERYSRAGFEHYESKFGAPIKHE